MCRSCYAGDFEFLPSQRTISFAGACGGLRPGDPLAARGPTSRGRRVERDGL